MREAVRGKLPKAIRGTGRKEEAVAAYRRALEELTERGQSPYRDEIEGTLNRTLATDEHVTARSP